MNKKTFALITAAGRSSRMGGEKKEFILLKDHPLIHYTIDPFDKTGFIEKIFITYTSGEKDFLLQLINDAKFMTPMTLIQGGISRQESVYKGLLAMEKENPDFVLIHDGSRPSVSKKLIEAVYKSSRNNKAAAPVIPLTDSLKTVDVNGFLIDHPDRDQYKCVQTPQGFLFKNILKAHVIAASDNKEYHDDTEIYSRYIGKVATVKGSKTNLKITYQEDLHFLKFRGND